MTAVVRLLELPTERAAFFSVAPAEYDADLDIDVVVPEVPEGGEVSVLPDGGLAVVGSDATQAPTSGRPWPKVRAGEWQVLTVSAHCGPAGEPALHVCLNGEPARPPLTGDPRLACDGPFAVVPRGGVTLFGGQPPTGLGHVRSAHFRTPALSLEDARAAQAVHGVWRCPGPCLYHNGPDAEACEACGGQKRKSGLRPPGDRHEKHPGLTVVVADSFEELVLDPTKHVFVDVYADWCGPCRQVCPRGVLGGEGGPEGVGVGIAGLRGAYTKCVFNLVGMGMGGSEGQS